MGCKINKLIINIARNVYKAKQKQHKDDKKKFYRFLLEATESHHVALVGLKLAIQTRLVLNAEMYLLLPPRWWNEDL